MSANSTVTLGRLYLAITLVLIALIVWQGVGMIRTRRQTTEIRGQISSFQKKEEPQPSPTPSPPPTPTPTPKPAQPEDPLAYITKKGLFSPAPPPPMLPECSGILGDRVILNNQFKKVGEEIDGWKVEKIGAERVSLRRNEDVAEVQLAKPTSWPPPNPPMPACTGIFGDAALLNNELHRIGDKIGDWEVTRITLDKVFIRNKEGNTNELSLVPPVNWPVTPPAPQKPPRTEESPKAPDQQQPPAEGAPPQPAQPGQPGTNPPATDKGTEVQKTPDQPAPQPGNPEQPQQGENSRKRGRHSRQ